MLANFPSFCTHLLQLGDFGATVVGNLMTASIVHLEKYLFLKYKL